ncbi:hypothetical protein ACN079_01905 [Pseudomonas sp. ABY48]|uniref:hypothetical protein n=1 Tax=Pseudomonas sp. ABY48 TaxID=3402865 RepID=UPI003B430E0F
MHKDYLAFFVESLPRYLAFPICGTLCDKFAPIRILHISQVGFDKMFNVYSAETD